MGNTITIKKGFDIKLKGEAQKVITPVLATRFAIKPTDFIGIFPKMLVKENDTVKAGTPLFWNKFDERIIFTSPVSGTVEAIKRGEKRVIEEIIIKAGTGYQSEEYDIKYSPNIEREKLIELLLKSGLWTSIRQRPFSVIANPDDKPRDIYISAIDSAPLGLDLPFIIKQNIEEFQIGLDALKILSNKNSKLAVPSQNKDFENLKNVDITCYKGPHPVGNISVQINKTKPINKGEKIWYIHPQDLIIIGRLLKNNALDTNIIISVCGSEVTQPQYFKTRKGVALNTFDEIIDNKKTLRYISGNVLTGKKIKNDGFLGFYENQFTIIPEGDDYEFLGWMMPGMEKPSFSRTFFTWLQPKKKYIANANLHGGHRALVMTGLFEKVFPMNIYPMQLIKACLAHNIENMENLGIYEVDEEDFALAEFVDPSKTEIQSIIREGLNLVKKEME